MTKIEALELELAARKMVDGTELDWGAVIRHYPTKQNIVVALDVYYPEYVELALGIIEGKPVWEGDTLYDEDGYSYRASPSINHGVFRKLSWNPPTPKTVMVELTVEDAMMYAEHLSKIPDLSCAENRLVSTCRKALEGLK